MRSITPIIGWREIIVQRAQRARGPENMKMNDWVGIVQLYYATLYRWPSWMATTRSSRPGLWASCAQGATPPWWDTGRTRRRQRRSSSRTDGSTRGSYVDWWFIHDWFIARRLSDLARLQRYDPSYGGRQMSIKLKPVQRPIALYWLETLNSAKLDIFLCFSDTAIILPNGYGQIVGRMKDMIIRGGENIYPREVNLKKQLLIKKQFQRELTYRYGA